MSLTSDGLDDIRQLMEATIGVVLKEQDKKFDTLEKRMNERFNAIDQRFDEQDVKLDTILDAVGADLNKHEERLDNHETRIVRLEKRAA